MIQIKKSEDGQFFFVVLASNGKCLSTSEMYKRKENCKGGIQSVADIFGQGKKLKIVDTTIE